MRCGRSRTARSPASRKEEEDSIRGSQCTVETTRNTTVALVGGVAVGYWYGTIRRCRARGCVRFEQVCALCRCRCRGRPLN
jgi:hypothetical protein